MKRLHAALLCVTTLIIGITPAARAANAVPATPTRDKGQTVYLGDTRVYPTGYNIADNNYFKLRDIGTLVGFGVEWNSETQTVEISTARVPSTAEGIKDLAANGASAKLSHQRITVDGAEVHMTAYQIGGNNYVKLRDVGKAVNFNVSFDPASRRVSINKEKPYQEPASGNAITSWNSTMWDFHKALVDSNWDKSKYLAVAEQYAPVITGKQNATVRDVIAALDNMKGAPVDAISFEDDRTVNLFWADELRKALGNDVPSNGGSENANSSAVTVTDEMLRAWELEMVDRINEERAKVGARPLVIDPDLMWSAGFWAEHLTYEFRHAEWGEIKEFADAQGIPVRDDIEDRISGENITGAGYLDVAGANPAITGMERFMDSQGHRNTILDSAYTRVGIGFAVDSDGYAVCTQHFGR